MRLSIVVLIHNNELTIKKCFDSILANTVLPYEIIVVNNLSSDKSIDIIKSYNIFYLRIINSKRNHIGYARRLGLKNVTGNYVLFIDADDYVDSKLFETLFKYNGYDLIRFQPIIVDNNILNYNNKFVYKEKECFKNGFEALKCFSVPNYRYGVFWIYCFKKKKQDIKKFKIYEDTASIPEIITKSRKVININFYGYFHVLNSNGYSKIISKEQKAKYFKKTCSYLIKKYKNNKIVRDYYIYHWIRKNNNEFKYLNK